MTTTPTPTRPEPTTPTREELLKKCEAMEAELAKVAVLAHSDPRKEVILCSVVVPYDTMETINNALKQRLTSEPAASVPVTPEKFADDAVQWLCELPDRTSPEDWPEACLVTGEELHAYLVEQLTPLLQSAAVPASPAEIEFNQKLKFVLENLAAMASLYDGCKNKKLNIKYHDDDLVSVHLGDLRKASVLLAYIKSAASLTPTEKKP